MAKKKTETLYGEDVLYSLRVMHKHDEGVMLAELRNAIDALIATYGEEAEISYLPDCSFCDTYSSGESEWFIKYRKTEPLT
jgi:hypothetical protein